MSKTELAKLIIAQDLFGLWGDDLAPACTATLLGAQKWAGEEVAPVSLLVYLRDSIPAARSLMVRHSQAACHQPCTAALPYHSVHRQQLAAALHTAFLPSNAQYGARLVLWRSFGPA